MDVLNQLHLGEDPTHPVLVEERGPSSFRPTKTGEYLLAGLELGRRSDRDAAVLGDLARTGKIIRLATSAIGALALLFLAVSLFPGTRSDVDAAVQAVGSEQLPGILATTSSSTTEVVSRPVDRETAALLIAVSDKMAEEMASPPPVTVPGQWVDPIVEPKSQWIDGGNGIALPDVLLRIRFCESTNNYQVAHVASSARGAYQFLTGSWSWYGHAERYGVADAHLATPAQQDEAALITFEADGARPWAESRPCWGGDINPNYLTARPPITTTTAATQPTSTTTGDGATTTVPPDDSTTTTVAVTTTSTDPSTTQPVTSVTEPVTTSTSVP